MKGRDCQALLRSATLPFGLPVFSQVLPIRVRPSWCAGVVSSLISRVEVGSVIPGDPTPSGSVRLVRQNAGRIPGRWVTGASLGFSLCVERWMAFVSDGRRVVPHMGDTRPRLERTVPQPTEPRYFRTAQVAELLHVSPKSVSRWAQEGRLPYLRTLGGHRRYPMPRSGR
jgi:excisionase family DNA binding protein